MICSLFVIDQIITTNNYYAITQNKIIKGRARKSTNKKTLGVVGIYRAL